MENLFLAWREFRRGKSKKPDVIEFEYNLEDNLFELHQELKSGVWRHSHYTAFNVRDPKLRRIHKACVRDRVLHHAVFRVLYPIFDKSFIFDSYSCRLEKGTHRAVNRLEQFCRQSSHNNHQNIVALKCDVRRFFDSIDQDILLLFIKNKIHDGKAIRLIAKIIRSFEYGLPAYAGDSSAYGLRMTQRMGLPLGNVTSQLFANIYLNELDQFVKHNLKVKHYLRYCDDFVILGEDKRRLRELILPVSDFLRTRLNLSLHSDKIIIRKYHQGIDFLGYVVLPRYRVLRTKTKRRILKKIKAKSRDFKKKLISEKSFNQSLESYLGILTHCCGYKIGQKIKNL